MDITSNLLIIFTLKKNFSPRSHQKVRKTWKNYPFTEIIRSPKFTLVLDFQFSIICNVQIDVGGAILRILLELGIEFVLKI